MAEGTGLTVLIAVDDSDRALDAFNFYASTLHRPQNRVVVMNVTEGLDIKAADYEVAAETYLDSTTKVDETAHAVNQKYTKKLGEHNISGKVVTEIALKPGEAVVDVAKKEQAKLVVMGTRGMGTVRRTILGSVSDYVLHHVHCPILVCRHD